MEKITYDEALSALSEAVRRRGEDYAYYDHFPVCQYFDATDREPMCVIGEASTLLPKYKDEVTNLLLEYNYSEFSDTCIPSLADYFTSDALELLYYAQVQQDFGASWGDALQISVAQHG